MLQEMNLKQSKRDEYFENLLQQIDIIKENLEFNKEVRPLKLMGLKASDELLASIYTAIFSISFALFEKFWSSMKS